MRFFGRYLSFVTFLCVFIYFFAYRSNESPNSPKIPQEKGNPIYRKLPRTPLGNACTMEKCFDFSKCGNVNNNLKVFVYPDAHSDSESESFHDSTHSAVYTKILRVIRESSFYTNDSSEACLFVLNIDTIDRDRRSENYVQDISQLIQRLPADLWSGGKNHVIFNLYHGTYPDYADHNLGFDVGHAMVGRASSSSMNLSFGFDFGFPLFHKEHPIRSAVIPKRNASSHRYMVSFKGKRYVYGIGSETRDSLHHLHNGETSIMVTTCRHNNDWKKFEDARCAQDNEEYDKWDYEELLANSTFCLTPRGRRLGSFRFLETLRAGCIPVVLSDDWELPFSEVIDWSEAVLSAPEADVLYITDMLWDVSRKRIQQMRKRGRILYHKHFSSVDKIVRTTFDMIFERIRQIHNQPPRLSMKLNGIPHVALRGSAHLSGTEAIVLCDTRYSGRINRIVNSLNEVSNITSVVVLWPSARGQPPEIDAFQSRVPLSLFVVLETNAAEFLTLISNSSADLLIFIDERVPLGTKDFVAMNNAIQQSPNQFIGWHSLSHRINNVPLGMLHFAAVRRTLIEEYQRWIPVNARQWVEDSMRHCHTILFNLMIIDLTMTGADIIGFAPPEPWMMPQNFTKCTNEISSMLYENNLNITRTSPVLNANR